MYNRVNKDVNFSKSGTWTVKLTWAEANTFTHPREYNSNTEVVTNRLFTKAWKIAHKEADRKMVGWTPILYSRDVFFNGKLVASYS